MKGNDLFCLMPSFYNLKKKYLIINEKKLYNKTIYLLNFERRNRKYLSYDSIEKYNLNKIYNKLTIILEIKFFF